MSVFEASEAFPEPSLDFHERALEQREMHDDMRRLSKLIGSSSTYTPYFRRGACHAWASSRQGRAVRCDGSSRSIQTRPDIEGLSDRRITDVFPDDAAAIAEAFWEILSRLQVSTTGTRIVAASAPSPTNRRVAVRKAKQAIERRFEVVPAPHPPS